MWKPHINIHEMLFFGSWVCHILRFILNNLLRHLNCPVPELSVRVWGIKTVTIHSGSAPVELRTSFPFYVLDLRPSAGGATFQSGLCGRAAAAVAAPLAPFREKAKVAVHLEPDRTLSQHFIVCLIFKETQMVLFIPLICGFSFRLNGKQEETKDVSQCAVLGNR